MGPRQSKLASRFQLARAILSDDSQRTAGATRGGVVMTNHGAGVNVFNVIGTKAFPYGAALTGAIVLCSACSPSKPPAPAVTTPAAQALWGDMKPVVSVKELMHDMIDP